MEALMKIDSNLVKKHREARAWSQDHLAKVSGLSLRTIQRVEAEGSASAETKMALASVFAIGVEELLPERISELTLRRHRFPGLVFGTGSGILGTVLGALAACFGIASGSNTAFEAGVAYGIVGVLSGLSFAAIGIVWGRYARDPQADA